MPWNETVRRDCDRRGRRRARPEGPVGAKLRKIGAWTIEIIKRSDRASGFEVLPRRWVVERTFAWLNRCRRLAKDWEATTASAEAWIIVAHIRLTTRAPNPG